jgi:hypothetical protein
MTGNLATITAASRQVVGRLMAENRRTAPLSISLSPYSSRTIALCLC